jgi:Transmembrane domain of unknown function (DUF3566)
VVIRKVDPWSVFAFSLLLYLSAMAVILLALAILYRIMGAVGVLEHITTVTRNLLTERSFAIHGGWMLARVAVLGLGIALIWSLINLFIAFLYNAVADLIGGIEVTLGERRRRRRSAFARP